jgi:subtilisin-like proprotein convertase family protein
MPGRLFAAILLFATASFGADDLRLVLERQSLTATWRTYHQFLGGVDVVGTAVIERVDADGSVHEVARELAAPAPKRRLLPMAQALASLPAGEAGERQFVNVNVNGEARPAWRVVIKERPFEPVAHYVDAVTGAEIRREPLYWTAKGRVFDPNPVAKLNDPALRDNNDAASAVPDAAYTTVDLPDLPPSGMLAGPNVAIVDLEAPSTPHADAGQPLFFDRAQPQFEEVNAYFHIDRTQRYMQSLGFTGPRRLVAYAIPVDPHGANGADNSYYVGGAANGVGSLSFGDGGTDDAEDSDIMLHEFGHAIQDWIAPGAFGGLPSAQARALGEGFGDYWSFSSNYVQTAPSGRDPFCIADWDPRCGGDDPSQNCSYPPGTDCLRRVDSPKTMASFIVDDTPGTEHRNGEIWSSALREIFMALVQQNGAEQGRRIADATVLEGTFGVPPNPTFNVMARKLLDADRALWGGAHAATICAAMTKRGIIAAADCGVLPRGELTIFQSGAHGVPIPDDGTSITATALVTDTRPIDRLQLRVDIEHPSRGDLQIKLIAPDGTTLLLLAPSLDRVADVHATFGSDIAPIDSLARFNGQSIAGTWKLVVTDTRRGDAGRLLSWAIVAKFAGDEPLAQRPLSSAPRQHIAAVAHASGVDGAQWRSDLFLFNKGKSAANVAIVFTPSGANGTTAFGSVNVAVGPGQVSVFRDVVAQLFATDGLGTLELQGDVQAWSRTYDATRRLAEVLEAVSSADAIGARDDAQYAAGLSPHAPRRTNLGVIETAGEAGTVRMTAFDLFLGGYWTRDVEIAPFAHLQFPMPESPPQVFPYVKFSVIAGAARIHGYASLAGPNADPRFVKAQQPRVGSFVAPVVADLKGVNGTSWLTGRWWQSVSPFPPLFARETYYDNLGNVVYTTTSNGGGFVNDALQKPGRGSGIFELPAGWVAWTRTEANFGAAGDEVVAIPITEALGSGDAADAIRIEHDAAFRTNVGATEVAGGTARLRFTLFDSGGNALGNIEKIIGPHQQLQFSIVEISATPVLDGRVRLEVVDGDGRVVGYASVVDNASSDAEFVRAR